MATIDLNGIWQMTVAEGLPEGVIPTMNMPQMQEGIHIDGIVPGNYELDLYRAGKIDEPFYSKNILQFRNMEVQHVVYKREICVTDTQIVEESPVIVFEGIDTVAEVFLNGQLIGRTDNMMMKYEFSVEGILREGENTLIVHILPVVVESRKRELPPSCNALRSIYDLLYVRKAAHMAGWDIMPRVLSAGIWKGVRLETRPVTRIKDVFAYTINVDTANNRASMMVHYNFTMPEENIADYKIIITAKAYKDNDPSKELLSQIRMADSAWHTSSKFRVELENVVFWWPHNYGEPTVYYATAELVRKDETVAVHHFNFGIRTIELLRSSVTDKDGNGEFCFVINNRRVFALGTNWVPLDAFHSNDINRLPQAFALMKDIGCNMVRCWGGNVYESDEFFELCDRNGIMVWQDFAMGCAVYPLEEDFYAMLRPEIEQTVKRLRNHPSLVLWAGDNECDYAYHDWGGIIRDPNDNDITRKVIPEVLKAHDHSRPYLPSSPYIDEVAYKEKAFDRLPEDHLWGPRDYFKGNFYKNTLAHFASETGYHGCPARETLEKFIAPEQLWPIFDENGAPKDDWVLHGTAPDTDPNGWFYYRTRLMASQVETLFGAMPDDLDTFINMSQISQGEAMKYFIERFRLSKWRRTGIIWWNIVDGWPQVSDAVVDYYFVKKLAFDYIRRSQQQVCFMFDEPRENGDASYIDLYAVSDGDVGGVYSLNITADGNEIFSGAVTVTPDSSTKILSLPFTQGQHTVYRMTWSDENGSVKGENHYQSGDAPHDYDTYRRYMEGLI